MKKLLTLFALLTMVCAHSQAQQDLDSAGIRDDGYVLSPRDLIVLDVYRQPDLTVRQRVDANGRVGIPLIGSVDVAGKTIREAESLISRQFIEQGYLRDPQVTLSIEEYARRGVSVIGEVQKPGFISFELENDSMDIREVMAQSGGFTSVARKGNIRVVRTRDGQELVFEVNFAELVSDRKAKPFQVYHGDVIIVPARIF